MLWESGGGGGVSLQTKGIREKVPTGGDFYRPGGAGPSWISNQTAMLARKAFGLWEKAVTVRIRVRVGIK